MKKFKVKIPYKEKIDSDKEYSVVFDVIASDKKDAVKKALNQFDKFEDFTYASWVRIPLIEKIDVEYVCEVEEPDPWSYL